MKTKTLYRMLDTFLDFYVGPTFVGGFMGGLAGACFGNMFGVIIGAILGASAYSFAVYGMLNYPPEV